MPDLLKSIDKVDDHTVKFTLNKPNAPFIANLAMDFAAIHSAEYCDAMLKAGTPEKFDQEPIGTGPFEFVDYQKDAVIRYKAFPAYFRGKQKIDTLVFAITPDAAVRMAKLRRANASIAPYPNPADLPKLKADPKLKVEQQEGLNIGYLAFNTRRSRPSTTRRPPGPEHGDRQGRHHQGGLSGRRPAGEEPDPADHLVLRQDASRPIPTIPTRPRSC